MYSYKLANYGEIQYPDIEIVTTPIKKKTNGSAGSAGSSEMLSIDLECNYKINRAKTSIDKINSYIWEDVKKYTNPYEYICSYNKHKNNYNHNYKTIVSIKTLSRSFFKMIEIIHEFFTDILNNKTLPNLTSVHIAEGPGGFIEATRYIRNYVIDTINNEDIAYGMTLVKYESQKNIPGWKQSSEFLSNHPEVKIINGYDGTGDIYNPKNIDFLNDTLRRVDPDGSIFITADGGFDFSIDYNLQEQISSKLIFSQVLAALKMQKIAGGFVCKFFDINLYFTTQILYLLFICYREVIIYKPFTSRIANSEKYIVCRGFKGITVEYLENLTGVLENWNRLDREGNNTINYIFKEIPQTFISRIRSINKEIVTFQIDNINYAISLIKTKKIYSEEWLKANQAKQLAKAKDWCRKYNILYH